MRDLDATRVVLMTLIENLRKTIGDETEDSLIKVLMNKDAQ